MAFTPGYGMDRVAPQMAPSGGVQLTPSYPSLSSSFQHQQVIHSPQYYEMSSPPPSYQQQQQRYMPESEMMSQPHQAMIASPPQQQHYHHQQPPEPSAHYPRFLTPPRRDLEPPSSGGNSTAGDQMYQQYITNTRITQQQHQPPQTLPDFKTPPRDQSPNHSHPQWKSDAQDQQQQQQPRPWRSGIQAPPPMMTPSSPIFQDCRVEKFRSQHLTPPHPLPSAQQPQLVGNNQSMISSMDYSPLHRHQSNLTLDSSATGASFLHSHPSTTHSSYHGARDTNNNNSNYNIDDERDEKLSAFRRNAEDYYSSRSRETSVLNRPPRPTLPFEPEVESGNQQLLPKHYDARYPTPTHHGMSSHHQQHQHPTSTGQQQQQYKPPGPKRATSAERVQRTNKTDPWFVSDTYISPSRRRMNHRNHTNDMPPHVPSMSHLVSSPKHSPNYSLSPLSDFLTPKSPDRVVGASLSPVIKKTIISEHF